LVRPRSTDAADNKLVGEARGVASDGYILSAHFRIQQAYAQYESWLLRDYFALL